MYKPDISVSKTTVLVGELFSATVTSHDAVLPLRVIRVRDFTDGIDLKRNESWGFASITWNDIHIDTPGFHSLRGLVEDGGGAQGESTAIGVTVQPVSIDGYVHILNTEWYRTIGAGEAIIYAYTDLGLSGTWYFKIMETSEWFGYNGTNLWGLGYDIVEEPGKPVHEFGEPVEEICSPPIAKNVIDPMTMKVTVKNVGEYTVPAGMYCEIMCGTLKTTGTTTADLNPGGSVMFGEGIINTIPEEWSGQTLDATATVWRDSTKTEQLATYTCPDILNVTSLLYSVEIVSMAVNTSPSTGCISGTKNIIDPYEVRVVIRNNGQSTVPTGAYIEVETVGTGQKFIYTTTSPIPVDGSITIGEGSIYTIPEEWAGQSFSVATSVWIETERIGYRICSDLLTVNPY